MEYEMQNEIINFYKRLEELKIELGFKKERLDELKYKKRKLEYRLASLQLHAELELKIKDLKNRLEELELELRSEELILEIPVGEKI